MTPASVQHNWQYRAIDQQGRRVRGAEEALDADHLAHQLERRGLILVGAEPATPPTFGGSARQVREFTRTLAALLPAGLPLSRALAAAQQLTGSRMAGVLDDVRGTVERGGPLADALSRHPAFFSPLYLGVVRAGERSGDLDGAFGRLTAQLERDERVRNRLLSASIYPLILLTLGGLAVLVMLLFVIPRFAELLEGAGARLPASTAALLTVSTALERGWTLIPLLILLAIGAGLGLRSTARGRELVAVGLLALPGVRSLRREQLAARAARLLSVLLRGGAPLLSALDDAAATVGDPIARDELLRIRTRVREGASMRQALGESTVYPPLLRQLVGVGEESGRLEEFLAKAADLFEERTERTVQRLVTLVEPAMIVGFGLVVGFVALSLFQAIYGVNAGSFR